MNYEIVHTTEYNYADSISLCHNLARLIPRSAGTQFCKKSNIRITPQPDVLNEYIDFFGNKVFYFAIQQEHKKMSVTVSSLVVKEDSDAKIANISKISWEHAKGLLQDPKSDFLEAKQFTLETPMTAISPEIIEYAEKSFTPGRPLFEAVHDLMVRIHKDFAFKTGYTTVATPLSTVMELRKGVCQDFAHLAIACVRSVGLAARYVSGYIETIPPPGKEKLSGVDASHAWFAVFIPQTGWLDFDPTNNMIPSDQHITIGWGREYSDIAPLKGVVLTSGQHTLTVSVNVKRV